MDGTVAADLPTVNKRELAKALGCSAPTLDNLIDRYADFPIESKGSNGRSYAFDPEKVKAFLVRKKEEELAAGRARMELLDQVQLPLLAQIGGGSGTESPALTPGQQLQTIKAARELDKLGVERGQLVETARLRPALERAFGKVAEVLDSLPNQLARRHNLPPSVISAVRETIAQERRRLHEQLARELGQTTTAEERDLAAAE